MITRVRFFDLGMQKEELSVTQERTLPSLLVTDSCGLFQEITSSLEEKSDTGKKVAVLSSSLFDPKTQKATPRDGLQVQHKEATSKNVGSSLTEDSQKRMGVFPVKIFIK